MAGRKQAGSPIGGPAYLAIGLLRRPHGLHGEMVLEPHTDFPERIEPGRKLYLGDKHTPASLAAVRRHGSNLLVRFDGYDTPESAGRHRNHWVYALVRDLAPLPQGKHYTHELIGLEVVDDDGNRLGILEEILETGANDVYLVRGTAGKELLLPAIPSVIQDLDMDRRILTVHLLDGLV
jgi:16S rRNA processing protein RimM